MPWAAQPAREDALHMVVGPRTARRLTRRSRHRMSDTEIVLGYWKIRGLAQPIRYALELAGAHYREDLYESVRAAAAAAMARGGAHWLRLRRAGSSARL